ncbi:acyl-CoA thioesterase [Flagellimonas hadalis]|uniref:Acyl-CoA thioesterase n=1 Tax=Flagellimonas hadalis TaxID=2597517 RepID=A0A5N5ITJ1_9FLAO|nr:acyl-ACP thioesterase domain-containing protein [Allomuricauda hadalis]KAB5491881.1 acyl-CoA thioesterase [Allomuricauda hadalis]
MNTFTEIFDVAVDDLDDLNHVNNIRYVEWIQDISKKHWEQVTDADIRKEMIWVVRNHNISYLKSAVLGDTVEVTTHIEASKGPLSIRAVEIKNHKTGELMVKSTTEWCLLDAKTFRPKRVPESVQELFK